MIFKIGKSFYDVTPKDEVWEELEEIRQSPKSIGIRRATSQEKNIVAAFAQALDPGADHKAYDRAKTAWVRKKKRIASQFKSIVDDLADSKITKNQFMNRAHKIFKDGYETAYRLGTDASGLDFFKLPSEDIRWLKRARSYEYKFLDKFADKLADADGARPSFHGRAQMYADTMDSMFDAGRVDAYPNESTKIWWELNPAKHCEDCLEMSMGSPYRPDNLPTTPGAGDTKCLSNCQCNLRIRYDRPSKIKINVQKVSKAKAREMGLLTISTWQQLQDLFPEEPTARAIAADQASMESVVKAVDWNVIDDWLTGLTELRMADREQDLHERSHKKRHALDKFNEAANKFPEKVSPFSTQEMVVLQKVGAIVRDMEGDE